MPDLNYENGVEVTLNGTPMCFAGLPAAGSEAPDFALVAKDLTEICLHDFKGRNLVLNIFPSLDTDVCAASVRRFNKDAGEYPNTDVLCVSMDLPFAAARFCSVNDITNVRTASAFRSSFGKAYGCLLETGPLRGLFTRAIVVIGPDGKIKGTTFSREITQEPDYDFVKRILKE